MTGESTAPARWRRSVEGWRILVEEYKDLESN